MDLSSSWEKLRRRWAVGATDTPRRLSRAAQVVVGGRAVAACMIGARCAGAGGSKVLAAAACAVVVRPADKNVNRAPKGLTTLEYRKG